MHTTLAIPVYSQPEPEMAESTAHASKAAAVLQIDAADVTTLTANPKNGSKTVHFKRLIRVTLGGKTRETALRCPCGAPRASKSQRPTA